MADTTKKFCITEGQRNVHMASEGVGFFLVAPLLIYLGVVGATGITPATRRLLVGFGFAALVVDGILLSKYVTMKPEDTP